MYFDDHLRVTVTGGSIRARGAVKVAATSDITVVAEAGRMSHETALVAAEVVRRGRPLESALPWCAARLIVHDARTGRTQVCTGGTYGSGLAYRSTPEALYLSTSVPWLRESGSVDVRWLAQRLLGSGEADGSPYPGVGFVPLGHRLLWRPGGGPEISAWYQVRRVEVGGAEEWIEAYRHHLLAVLEQVMEPAGEVTALTSAGLDSSTVTAFAASAVGPGRRVRALIHTPVPTDDEPGPGWLADDLPDAQALPRRWPNIDLEPVRNDARLTPLDVLPQYCAQTGLPAFNPSNMVWMLEAQKRARSRVVLTGASGNRTFSYQMRPALGPLLREGSVGALIDETRRRAAASGTPLWRVLAGDVRSALAAGVPGGDGSEFLLPEVRSALAPAPDRSWNPGTPMRDDVLTLGLMSGRPTRLVDVLSAPPLVGLVASLPAAAFVGEGVGRSVARRVGRGVVPDEIRMRRELGAQAHDARQWYRDRGGLADELNDLLRVPQVREVMDTDRIQEQWVRVLRGDRDDWYWADRAIGMAVFLMVQSGTGG